MILDVNCPTELNTLTFLNKHSSCQNETQSALAEASRDQGVSFAATDTGSLFIMRNPVSPTPCCSTGRKKQFLFCLFQLCNVRFNSSSLVTFKYTGFQEYAL